MNSEKRALCCQFTGERKGRQLFSFLKSLQVRPARPAGGPARGRSGRMIFHGGIFILLIILTLLVTGYSLLFTMQSVFAWTPPSAAPPGDNVPKPLNISPTAQYKLGNLGIGTTAPLVKLDVDGNMYVRNNAYASQFIDYDNPSYYLNPASTGIALKAAGIIQVDGSGNNYFVGSIGIGTTGPEEKLEIADKVQITRSGSALLYLKDTSAGANHKIWAIMSNDGQFKISSWNDNKSGVSDGIIFYKNPGSTVVGKVVFPGSSVGVTENSPSARLHVLNSLVSGDSFRVDDESADTTPFLIDNDGNVGIGTTSPSGERLHINHGASSSLIQFTNNATGGMANVDGTKLGVDGTGNFIIQQNEALPIYFRTNAANTRMTIDENGNVGIGTTAPQDAQNVLAVRRDQAAYTRVELNNASSSGGTTLRFYEGATTAASIYHFNYNNHFVIAAQQADSVLRIGTGGGDIDTYERMRITAEGNVGIGTTSPNQLLDVQANSIEVADNTINFTDVADGYVLTFDIGTNTWAGEAGGGGGGWVDDGTIVRLETATDNVGIGTTAPLVKLDVDGNMYVRNNAYASQFIDYDNPSYYLNPASTGIALKAAGIIQVDGSGNNYFAGSVGIGTTSPGAALEVSGRVSQIGLGNSTYSSTFFGYQAGLNDDLSNNANSAFGNSALYSNTSGYYNTAIGYRSLYSNITGINNTAIGHRSLTSNTAGHYNTAIGNYALRNNTADYNTAVGYSALTSNTTGAGNTATGREALNANTTGAGNTAYGYQSLLVNIIGNQNTATGYRSLYFNTADYNTADGYEALMYNSTGIHNTATGKSALYSNATGSYNTATGSSALNANTGSGNTAYGYNALGSNATGSYNTATGNEVLGLNTTGSYNTAYGDQSLYWNTGDSNTAIGTYTLYDQMAGTYNTALGYNTGRGINTGNNNTIIGANVIDLAPNLSNNIIIADGSGNQRIRVDSSGNVGIGTTSPTSILDISGDTAPLVRLSRSGGVGQVHLLFNTLSGNDWSIGKTTANDFIIQEAANARLYLKAGGNVGIGVTNPTAVLHVVGGTASSGTGAGIHLQAQQGGTGADGGDVVLRSGMAGSGGGVAGDILFKTSTVQRMNIDDLGSVGIGSNFVSSSGLLQVKPQSSGIVSLAVLGAVTDNSDVVRVSNNAGTTRFLTIDSSGNVGIGVTNPGEKLEINGNLKFTSASNIVIPSNTAGALNITNGSDNYLYMDTRTNASTQAIQILPSAPTIASSAGASWNVAKIFTPSLTFTGSTTVNAVDGLTLNLAAANINSSSALTVTKASTFYISGAPSQAGMATITTPLALDVASGTSHFGGNVGIGNTSPTKKLVVAGTTAVEGNLRVGKFNETYGLVRIYAQGAGSQWGGVITMDVAPDYNASIGNYGISVWEDYLRIGPNTAGDALVLDGTDGNVGIGTTSPGRKLDILDASNPQLRLTQAGGTTYADFQMESDGDLVISVDGQSNQLVLDDQGMVGIGKTPASTIYALDVNGIGHASYFRVSNAFEAVDGSVSTPSFNFNNGGGDSNTGMWSPANDAIAFSTGASERLRIDSSGKVGIGTTNPGGLLGLSDANTYLDVDGSNNLTFTDAVTGTKTLAQLSAGGGGGGGWVDDGAAVRLETITDFVGIGTSSPSVQLEVAGTAEVNALMIRGTYLDSLGINNRGSSQISMKVSNTGGYVGGDSSQGTSYLSAGTVFRGSDGSDWWTTSSSNTAIRASIGTIRFFSDTGLTANSVYTPTERMRMDSSGNFGIGVTNPSAPLEVSGRVSQIDLGSSTFFGYQAGLNDDLSSNANSAFGYEALLSNSTGSNNTAYGYQSLYSNTTGGYNIATGYRSLYNNISGGYNTATGYYALYLNAASNNTAYGAWALRNNTTGNQNTAIGYSALYSNTIGTSNTATGHNALTLNTASSNTAYGAYALDSNTTGTENTAIGRSALDSNISGASNVATGAYALYLSTGSNNTATGHYVMLNNTSGSQNTAYGKSALYSNISANNNTAIGYESLYSNNTGAGNTATGYQSLRANNANNNTAYGAYALDSNTTGTENTAIGRSALDSNISGASNVATGAYALYLSTGSNNTATGHYAMLNNTSGSQNTAYGKSALYSNISANDNTAIGYQSLYSNNTGAGNTATGYDALYSNTTGGYNIATGYRSLYNNISGGQNTATGYYALYNNTASSNTATGYYALYSNNTGTQNTATGRSALRLNISGSYNTATGYRALYNNTASYNTAYGEQSLYSNTTGSNNTAIGNSALRSNNSGSYNTATGVYALYTTTGSYNTATGYRSLMNNNSGYNNTAIGSYALYSNIIGTQNTAIGYYALNTNTGGDNTAIGTYALRLSTTGGQNTAIGGYSLYNNTSGTYNTAIGYNTGGGITTGIRNTIIGASVSGLASNLTGNIIIADGYGNQRIRVDSSGNVGIGTTAPNSNLEIIHTAGRPLEIYRKNNGVNYATSLTFSLQDSNSTKQEYALIYGAIESNTAGSEKGYLRFDTYLNGAQGEKMRITANGNVGIGDTSPSTKLHIEGDLTLSKDSSQPVINFHRDDNHTPGAQIAYLHQWNDATSDSGDMIFKTRPGAGAMTERMRIRWDNGNVGIGDTSPTEAKLVVNGTAGNFTGVWSNLSDERMKWDIQPLEDSLDIISQLQGVSFYWKDLERGEGLQRGFIAQDVESVLPEWVRDDGNGYLMLEKIGVEALLVEAVKEQQAQIEELRKEIKELKSLKVEKSQEPLAKEIIKQKAGVSVFGWIKAVMSKLLALVGQTIV